MYQPQSTQAYAALSYMPNAGIRYGVCFVCFYRVWEVGEVAVGSGELTEECRRAFTEQTQLQSCHLYAISANLNKHDCLLCI